MRYIYCNINPDLSRGCMVGVTRPLYVGVFGFLLFFVYLSHNRISSSLISQNNNPNTLIYTKFIIHTVLKIVLLIRLVIVYL